MHRRKIDLLLVDGRIFFSQKRINVLNQKRNWNALERICYVPVFRWMYHIKGSLLSICRRAPFHRNPFSNCLHFLYGDAIFVARMPFKRNSSLRFFFFSFCTNDEKHMNRKYGSWILKATNFYKSAVAFIPSIGFLPLFISPPTRLFGFVLMPIKKNCAWLHNGEWKFHVKSWNEVNLAESRLQS